MSHHVRVGFAEAIGTAVLVIGGAGTAIFATGGFNEGLSVGILGVSLAFGLSLLCMAYLIGRISGCHINPAVTVGLAAAGLLPIPLVPIYIIAQFIGAFIGAVLVWLAYFKHFEATDDADLKLC